MGFLLFLQFVEDITLKQTQDTFSDPKYASPASMQASIVYPVLLVTRTCM